MHVPVRNKLGKLLDDRFDYKIVLFFDDRMVFYETN